MKKLFFIFHFLFFIAQGGANAAVVARPTVANSPRPSALMRMPTIQAAAAPAALNVTEPEPEPVTKIKNKSAQFQTILENACATSTSGGASAMAELIRAQRAALDSADNTALATATLASGANACDDGLRTCMKQTCANDFSKCAMDSDTELGRKLDACRRNLNCGGAEYAAFTNEIKADIALSATTANFDDALLSGTEYMRCVTTRCGNQFKNCIARGDMNNAITACNAAIKNNAQIENPDVALGAKFTDALTSLRGAAEKRVAADEARLYELRELMRASCARMGAMFDERTLDCVFTVNFFTDISQTPTASKKAYAGSTFTCTADWFGVDVTTHLENAARRDRATTAASSAALGSGLGIAAGALSSGAINRAIDTQRAERAADAAQTEHDENFGDGAGDSDGADTADAPEQTTERRVESRADRQEARAQRQRDRMENRANEQAEATRQNNDK